MKKIILINEVKIKQVSINEAREIIKKRKMTFAHENDTLKKALKFFRNKKLIN